MKKIFLTVAFLIIAVSLSFAQNDTLINKAVALQRLVLQNRQDSTTWDFGKLNDDKAVYPEKIIRPIRVSAFPVPKYELLGEGTFNGIGFGSQFRKFGNEGNHLIYPYFIARRNKLTDSYIPKNKDNEVFFILVVLSDIHIDTINYSHAQLFMTSRNNPDYVGEGYVKTQNDEINYLAFLTADRNEYAVVNMRLFNLKYGRVILIAPQKDGSLRSMQLDPKRVLSMPINSEQINDVENYLDEILKQKNVEDFFTYEGNI